MVPDGRLGRSGGDGRSGSPGMGAPTRRGGGAGDGRAGRGRGWGWPRWVRAWVAAAGGRAGGDRRGRRQPRRRELRPGAGAATAGGSRRAAGRSSVRQRHQFGGRNMGVRKGREEDKIE
jgi:hypothetical protein